jgi:sugar phosphate permease
VRWPRIYYGWYIVAACWLITFYLAGFFFLGFTNIFDPMRRDLGWSAAATALAFSIQRLEGGFISPVVGFLLDRYGARRLVVTGMILLGLAFVLMSRMQAIWQFYAIFALLSVSISIGFTASFNAAAVRWFVKKRTLAISIIYTGSNFSALIIPAFVWMIHSLGWRESLFLVGLGTWVFLVPLALVVRSWPEQYGYLPDGEPLVDGASAADRQAALDASQRASGSGLTVRQALRTPTFWLVSVAFALFTMNMGTVTIFVVPHLTSARVGLSPQAAALVVSLFLGVGGFGRLLSGYLGDRVRDKKVVLVTVFLLQGIAMLILGLTTTPGMAVLFALVFGPAQGGIIPIQPAFYADYFGSRAFNSIQGLSQSLSVIGGVAGPLIAGLIFDRAETYAPAFFILAALTAVAIPLLLIARRPAIASLLQPSTAKAPAGDVS